jgi:hypothetical protein
MLMFGMVGCAKKTPPPKAVEAPIHNATQKDCEQVYGQVLIIALIEQLEPEQLYSKEALDEGANLLDKHYTETGKKQTFFAYCVGKLNTNQTTCMINAGSFLEMGLCEALYKDKKSESK